MDDIYAIRQEHALKWKQINQSQIEAEKETKEKEDLKHRINMMQINLFIKHLENIEKQICYADSIVKIDALVASIHNPLKDHIMILFEMKLENHIIDKIFSIISTINQNENTKFNLNTNDYERKSSQYIIKNIKNILSLLNCDPDILDIQMMDTSGDEDLARILSQDLM